MLERTHQFHVVSDDFPLTEDEIIGLPFLAKYRYNVTNEKLTLDEIILPFQNTDNEIGPGETLTSTQYIEGKPTTICFINTENDHKMDNFNSRIHSKRSSSKTTKLSQRFHGTHR